MPSEVADQAHVLPRSEQPVQGRCSQIRIYKQNSLADTSESNGQIAGDGGLALSGLRAADKQGTGRTIGGRKQDRCSQTAKRFDQWCLLRLLGINAMPGAIWLSAVPIPVAA
jgi:hypothetical protein